MNVEASEEGSSENSKPKSESKSRLPTESDSPTIQAHKKSFEIAGSRCPTGEDDNRDI